jgi:predicted glycoside hydrolase/deacetylase ChbG (UPF0249 family)
MVFMEDSERAAKLAEENGVDAGLHLNFSGTFATNKYSGALGGYQNRLIRFLRGNKYSQLLYNPFLRKAFFYSYQAQAEEFVRLFGKPPSHINGHHHMHLCANLLFSKLIPAGTKLRRNFSFWPGEKSRLNRTYRWLVDLWLARRYRLTDYFFDLTQCVEGGKLDRVASLAKSGNVELMTHPGIRAEEEYLMSDEFQAILEHLEIGSYALI